MTTAGLVLYSHGSGYRCIGQAAARRVCAWALRPLWCIEGSDVAGAHRESRVQEEPGVKLDHREFLAIPNGDPRPDLIERLVDDMGASGNIVVHHAGFETNRIRELAAFSPAHGDVLLAMLSRIVDTEIPFKRYWYLHPGLQGRSSIKVVLPTLVPELSYEGMEIADGEAAAASFEDMFEGTVTGNAAEIVCENLIAYCRLDTMAMARIVETLRELVGR